VTKIKLEILTDKNFLIYSNYILMSKLFFRMIMIIFFPDFHYHASHVMDTN